MKKREISAEIDKLTNSIANTITGDSFETIITKLEVNDIKQIIRKNWQFDWNKEIKNPENEVYKLTIVENLNIIQGLLSLTDGSDHIFMNLLENASFNKGKNKIYEGVAGNLVAYACKLAFEKGYDGFVSFYAKNALIDHYQRTLGAKRMNYQQMYIDSLDARKLVTQYFKTL